jgi:hypothetical protein
MSSQIQSFHDRMQREVERKISQESGIKAGLIFPVEKETPFMTIANELLDFVTSYQVISKSLSEAEITHSKGSTFNSKSDTSDTLCNDNLAVDLHNTISLLDKFASKPIERGFSVYAPQKRHSMVPLAKQDSDPGQSTSLLSRKRASYAIGKGIFTLRSGFKVFTRN